MVYFHRVLKTMLCPVPGSLAIENIVGRLWEHFIYRHFHSRVELVQERRETLPRCRKYGMNFPAGRILKHQRMARCDKNEQMCWQRRDVAIVN